MDFEFALPHNIVSRRAYRSDGQLIDHMSDTYTKTYQYSPKGLPLTGNMVFPNGEVREQIFIYRCES